MTFVPSIFSPSLKKNCIFCVEPYYFALINDKRRIKWVYLIFLLTQYINQSIVEEENTRVFYSIKKNALYQISEFRSNKYKINWL